MTYEELFFGTSFLTLCALAGWVTGGLHYGVMP